MRCVYVFVAVIFLSLPGAAYQEDVTLPLGEELEYGNRSIEYTSLEALGYSLTVENERGVIDKRYSGEDFYEVLGEDIQVGEAVFKPEAIDREDRELEARVEAPREWIGSSELNVTAPEYIVKKQDETFTVPLEVSNEGGVPEDYRLQAETPEDITASFSFRGYNVTRISTQPGETESLEAEIEIEEETETGQKSINFSIRDRSSSEKTFAFTVTGSGDEERELSMRLEQSYIEKEAGTDISTEFRVRNIGDGRVEDVEPEISTPENWNHSLNPEDAENISEDEFQDFELSITVPSTASSGDYFVDAGLENTEEFDAETLRVNVSSQNDGLGFFGIFLALIAVLLVGGVYRVFGRR